MNSYKVAKLIEKFKSHKTLQKENMVPLFQDVI